MNRKNLFKSVLVLLFSFILLSCNKTLPPGEYDSAEVGKVKKVIPGTIISKRPVNLRRNMSNITKKQVIALKIMATVNRVALSM